MRAAGAGPVTDHVAALTGALPALAGCADQLERWGFELADRLVAGGRLLAVGNGGSAAQAQHLTGELVGRYEDRHRPPLSAIALHADTSALTAVTNDDGAEAAFARQVRAHGRAGDVLVALSTSGASSNVLAAVRAAQAAMLTTWALTGPAPNALAGVVDDVLVVDAPRTATVQEVHLVALHLLCGAVERRIAGGRAVAELLPSPARSNGSPARGPGAG